jgi:hypothetical protein
LKKRRKMPTNGIAAAWNIHLWPSEVASSVNRLIIIFFVNNFREGTVR